MNKIFIVVLLIINNSCSIQIELETDISNKNIFISDWKKLSLHEKVGQMIMVRIRGDFYNSENNYRKVLNKWLSEYAIGGIITFGGSIHGTFQNIINFNLGQNIHYWLRPIMKEA